MEDCDDAVETTDGAHWLPYHNRGLVAKLQAEAERLKDVEKFAKSKGKHKPKIKKRKPGKAGPGDADLIRARTLQLQAKKSRRR